MGLAPPQAGVGDKICVLYGGNAPFVLRNPGDDWNLIGACFVLGIVGGVAVENERFMPREFWIS
jgi:hypothetical protein